MPGVATASTSRATASIATATTGTSLPTVPLEYVRSYRRAFEQGYRDGYDQYARGRYRNGGSYGSYGRDGYYRDDPRYDEEGRIYEIPRR